MIQSSLLDIRGLLGTPQLIRTIMNLIFYLILISSSISLSLSLFFMIIEILGRALIYKPLHLNIFAAYLRNVLFFRKNQERLSYSEMRLRRFPWHNQTKSIKPHDMITLSFINTKSRHVFPTYDFHGIEV